MSAYLLDASDSEEERLKLQAWVWEPEVERMLDAIGVQQGWSCLDLACGPLGIVGPLSRRAGPAGRVVGLDMNGKQLAALRGYASECGLSNVETIEGDAYNTSLPAESFDLVHVRFLFAPVGRDEELLDEMLRLTRRGGLLVIQEPDAASWSFYPPGDAFTRLKAAILAAFRGGGGDFDAGQRTYQMLRRRGLDDLGSRAGILTLRDRHPYMRLPVQFAGSLRKRILGANLLTEAELDALIAGCERMAADPATFGLSFVVTQVWGRKP